MRGWIILLETAFSIILLTAAYLYLVNNLAFQKVYSSTIYPEHFRSLVNTCAENYVYMIYNLTNNRTVVCINGKNGTIKDLSGHILISTYLFSGDNSYDPFALYLYS